jgi:hypothetical protein
MPSSSVKTPTYLAQKVILNKNMTIVVFQNLNNFINTLSSRTFRPHKLKCPKRKHVLIWVISKVSSECSSSGVCLYCYFVCWIHTIYQIRVTEILSRMVRKQVIFSRNIGLKCRPGKRLYLFGFLQSLQVNFRPNKATNHSFHTIYNDVFTNIQDVPGGKVNILGNRGNGYTMQEMEYVIVSYS